MKRIKSFQILYVFIFSVLFLCLAPHGAFGAEQSPVLGEILKNTEAHYQQVHAFVADFRQSTTSSAASAMTTTEASGRLYYEKPRQMRWEYQKPDPQTFVANQQLAWLYAPSDSQISLFDANSLFASPLAQAFFEGIVELKNNFQVTIDPKQSNKASAVLKLVPKTEDPNIKTLYLRIDLQSYRIMSVESLDALGNTNRIVLDSQTATPHLDPKLFQLEVPPGTTVTDADGRELNQNDINNLKQKLLSK